MAPPRTRKAQTSAWAYGRRLPIAVTDLSGEEKLTVFCEQTTCDRDLPAGAAIQRASPNRPGRTVEFIRRTVCCL